jgi:alanine dehydrogenase
MKTVSFGLPRMHKEQGERRDFLPNFVARLEMYKARVFLEEGYGSGVGLNEEDYRKVTPSVQFVTEEECYQQDYIIVLRYPNDQALQWMRPGACLISMVHYPTRPQRIEFLRSLNTEAISMDTIKDDIGRRLVENLKSVAWNGIEVAFQTLKSVYPPPGFMSPARLAIQVTLLGAGAVGGHAVHAAINYGEETLRKTLALNGAPGVHVNVLDYDLTNRPDYMRELLARTDILVDATLRPDPSRPVIPNAWIAYMPEYAILLDLSVDPYDCASTPFFVKGIEGVPQGNLDQYVFAPNDPAYELLPECVNSHYRRYAASCYSWPGIHPRRCMQLYGRQLQPLVRTILEKGGIENISPEGTFFERALSRSQLSRWMG